MCDRKVIGQERTAETCLCFLGNELLHDLGERLFQCRRRSLQVRTVWCDDHTSVICCISTSSFSRVRGSSKSSCECRLLAGPLYRVSLLDLMAGPVPQGMWNEVKEARLTLN